MKTVDPVDRQQPLGKPIRKPVQTAPEWHPVDGARKGIGQSRDGKLRTNLPLPPP